MFSTLSMYPGKDSTRDGKEIQKILNNYFFIDPEREVFDLMRENWFFDLLEDVSKLTEKHYDEYKIYVFSTIGNNDVLILFSMIFCNDNFSNSKSFDLLSYEVSRLEKEIYSIKPLFLVFPIEDEEDFKRVMKGDFIRG